MVEYLSILGSVGKFLGNATQKVLAFLSSVSVNVTPFSARIINLILFLLLIYLVIKVIQIPKTIIKYSIIILLVILVFSTLISFTG